MSYRKVPLVQGEYFHIYNRGNSKQKIFIDDEDRNRFIKLLYLSNTKNNINFRDNIVKSKIDALDYEKGDDVVSIGAWVLMPNHFHLYITSPEPGSGLESNIALFMRKLSGSYAKYFNKKYNRTGALFEGKFKATHVSDDIQAKYLFSYIHLNPIKIIEPTWKSEGIKDRFGALTFLNNYKWSSYKDFKKIIRKENKILHLENFPNYFINISDFDNEIIGWLK